MMEYSDTIPISLWIIAASYCWGEKERVVLLSLQNEQFYCVVSISLTLTHRHSITGSGRRTTAVASRTSTSRRPTNALTVDDSLPSVGLRSMFLDSRPLHARPMTQFSREPVRVRVCRIQKTDGEDWFWTETNQRCVAFRRLNAEGVASRDLLYTMRLCALSFTFSMRYFNCMGCQTTLKSVCFFSKINHSGEFCLLIICVSTFIEQQC